MKWCSSVSISALVTTADNTALKGTADYDAVLVVELEEDKVVVTVWNGGFSISTGDIVTTTGTAILDAGLAVSIDAFVTTCSSLSVSFYDIG